jgi:hypothetical protein
MPTHLTFRDICALWRAGVVLSEDVPALVSELLESGTASKALEDVAWLRSPVAAELEPLFARAATELREPPLSPTASRWRAGYVVAEQIVSGATRPRRGAEVLYRLCLELDVPDGLTSFIYYACDYGEGGEDRAAEEAWFDERILEDARELLAGRPEAGEGPPRAAA